MGLAGGKGLGQRASTHLLALEPRMMFDAAAVATTEAVLAHTDAATHDAVPTHDPLLAAFAPALAPDARETSTPHAMAAPATGAAREIVFIDTAVADYRQLADRWASRGQVILLDATADGVEQMRAALAGRNDLSAIHIVSHGEAGRLSLGTARLDATAIGGGYAASLAEIGQALAPAGDILVYGCDFAAGGEGARAVEALATVTHADIAASNDRTGAATRGGDWELETQRGVIEAPTLAALDWAHTLDPNTAVPISVVADSLTVTVPGAATPVVSGTTGYGADNRSADVGVGAVARWANAATLADGTTADLKATVVALTAGDAVRFNRPGIGANGDDPTFLLRDLSNSTGNNGDGVEVQIRWELVRSGTDTVLPANVQFNILDIDGIGGQPNSRETVSTSTENLAYYTRARQTDIFFTTSLDRITASGTQNENVDTTAPVSQQSAATFDWTAVSSFTLTYRLAANNAVTTQAQFYHDGDADFIYTDPVYVSIPRLDLDGDDSTAPGNDARFAFREGDPAVAVVDADVVVRNPMGPDSIIGGTVRLTNARAGDVLTVGALPANISAATTSANDTITVTLSGAGSEADYAAAFRAIGFRNGSDTPDPTQRIIEVAFSNSQLTSALAISRIDVIPVNDAPVARPNAATTAEDTPVTIPVLANDGDPDGDPLTVTGASALNGSVTVNPDGTLTYRPNADYNGTDTVTYTISDGNGGTATGIVTVTVTPVNDAPSPAGTLPPRSALDRDTVSYPTATAFTDVDGDTLTYAATGLPAGLAIDAATGVISGTLDRSASQPGGGRYTVTVTARDPSGATAAQAFVLTVANPAPTARDDAATTAEDTPVVVTVLGNDTDPDGDPLSVTGAVADSGSVTVNPDNTLSYRPNPNFNGTDTIRYTISDGEGGTSAAIVVVTVTPANDPPRVVVALPPQSGADAANISFATAYGFTDPDGDTLAYAAAGLPAGLVIDAATGVISGTLGRSASQPNGGRYTVTVTATDPSGAATAQAFTFTATNPAPIARPDTVTTAEDTPVTIPVLTNDEDPDGDPLAVTAATAGNGTVAINPGGTLTYTPNPDFTGTDTIRYTISDGEGGTATTTVTVTVTPVNDAPRIAAPLPPLSAVDAAAVSIPTAGGFADPDGDALTYTATGLPAGLAIDAATGTITGTLDRSASQPGGGVYAITVTATDPSGAVATQGFTLTVTNPAPTAIDDSATTPENTAFVVRPLANDADADGDPLTITAAAASDGSVAINPDGTLTYTPRLGFRGTDTIAYTIADGEGGIASATVTILVTGQNGAPQPVGTLPPQAAVDAAIVTFPTAGGFADPDGDTLTYTATGLPAGLVIDATSGVVSGTLDRSASQPNGGGYTVSVTATDPFGASTTQSFAFTVTNPPPTATNDAATTAEDTPVVIPVLANDTDPDGDPLTVIAASAPNGRVTVNPDGTLTYTPNADFNGTDTISYTIADGEGGTARAIVTVTVNPVNDAPRIAAALPPRDAVDGAAVSFPTAGGFADPDGDTLSYTATGLPAGLTIDTATGAISGTLDRSASQPGGGVYAVTVTATDPAGAAATQGFALTVGNPAPTATNDTATTAEDTPVVIPVLANDTDPDGDPLAVIGATAVNGGVVVNPDGSLTYTPNADFTGTDTIDYTISDREGGTARAVVTVTVTPVNDAPRPAPFQTGYVSTDGAAFTLPLAPAFTDPDGDALTYAATGLPAGLTVDPATGVVGGTIDRSASQPNGGVYTVQVSATDPAGASATRTITLTVTNPAPTARNDTATTPENLPVTIPVLANDTDPDGDPLRVTGATAANGSVAVNPDGTLTYTPTRGFIGVDTIRYTISDGEGGTADAIVTVTVGNLPPVARPIADQSARDGQAITLVAGDAFSDPSGDALTYSATGLPPGLSIDPATGTISGTLDRSASQPGGGLYDTVVTARDGNDGTASTTIRWTVANPSPSAADDIATTRPGTPVTIPVLANDSDADGDPLTVTAAAAANGAVAINPDGTLTYTPAPGFTGTDTIAYTVSDGEGGTASAIVTVAVVNAAPIARPDDATTRPGLPVIVPVLANDSDADGDPLTVTAATAANGAVAVNPDGTLTYTPAPGFTGTDSITYTVSDGRGATASAIVTVSVAAENRAPVAPAISDQAMRDGQAVALPTGFIDPDGDSLVYTATGLPPGLAIDPASGIVRGTVGRSASQAGGGVYLATITAGDGRGGTATTVVRFTVTNPPPIAMDDAAGTRPGTPVTIPILANDSDADGDPLTVTAATAANGAVAINPDGTLTYTPAPGFTGTDTIAYTLSDGEGGTAAATVTVTVTDGNRPPLGSVVPPRSDVDGARVMLPLAPAFRDPDGDPLTYAAAGLPPGLVLDPATGVVRGTITPGSATGGPAGDGRFPVTVTARDPSGATATVTFVWTVGNAAPVAGDDRANAVAARPVTIPILANDSDPEGDPLTVIAATAANGTVAINPDGTLAYTPAPRFAGTDTIAYTVSDGRGGVATAVVTVTVVSPQSPPVVPERDRPVPAIGGVPTRIDALAGVTDPDGDPLTVVGVTAGTGIVTIQPDGTLLYVPPLGFAGLTTIGFTVSDGRGGITTGVIPVQVADGRGADVEQLLRFGRPHLLNPPPGFATVRLSQGEVRNPLILLSTVNGVRSLDGTAIGERPVEGAVNAARTLRGTTLDPDAPIAAEVARLTRLTDFRDAGDRLFDQRWGDFLVRGLTGFSVAADRDAGVMVESVVRGHAIYVEIRDTTGDDRVPIRTIEVRPASGEAKPAWLHVDPRGLAIIERGAEMDELHLIVRVTRADGRVTTTPIAIEGETGVVTIDRPVADRSGTPSGRAAPPLDATLSTSATAARAEADRLSRLFQ